MGHKNQNLPPAPPPPPPVPGGGVTAAILPFSCPASLVPIDQNLKGDSVVLDTTVKLECEKTIIALRRGNYTKALRLVKQICAKNENSPHLALIYRVQGTVFVKVSSIIDDPDIKQRHLRSAIESAKKAVSLAPNSIEFAHFYANLLYEAAVDCTEYDEVLHECERALSIENPSDPGTENWQDEGQQKISSADALIGNVRNELKFLIQKSNFASIQSWVRNLAKGGNFRHLPLGRDPKDPMGRALGG